MDPTHAVTLLKELSAQTTHGLDSESLSVIAAEMADLFTGLDIWLQNGGFLPAQWSPAYDNATDQVESDAPPFGNGTYNISNGIPGY